MRPRAGSKALIREINEALVLDVVRAHRPVARGRIAAETGLSPATVTGITSRLLGAGLLTETDAVRNTGGRPARLLDLGTDAVLAAGVRLSNTEAYVVLVNLRGDVVASHQEPLTSTRPQDVSESIARAVGLPPRAERPRPSSVWASPCRAWSTSRGSRPAQRITGLGERRVPAPVDGADGDSCRPRQLCELRRLRPAALRRQTRLPGPHDLQRRGKPGSVGCGAGRVHRGFSGTAGGSRTPASARGRSGPATAALRTVWRPGPATGVSSESSKGAARSRGASPGVTTTSSRAQPTGWAPPLPTPPRCSAPSGSCSPSRPR